MLTSDRDVQIDELLGASIASFDIPEASYLRAVARYEDVGEWLSEYWAGSSTDGVVYPQGSFRLGTVVQPIGHRGEYDIDLVCRRDLAKESTTQAALKQDVGTGLGRYVASRPEGTPTRGEGKRCWTLDYEGEPFHMDVLPALPDAKRPPNAILLTDKDLRTWQHSDPIDYATWFHHRMHEEFIRLSKALAVETRMDVADVPSWRVKTTLQRTVQALKRHRDLRYVNEPDDGPASIIITTLAARAYEVGGTLAQVLVDVTSRMPTFVERRNGVYWVENPVQPEENFADRWQSHPERRERFFEWIERAHEDFAGFGADRGVDRFLEKIARTFGDGPAKVAGEAAGSRVVRVREAGLLGIDAAGLLGTAARRPAPSHVFHGDATPSRQP
jgi:hypothetical protein